MWTPSRNTLRGTPSPSNAVLRAIINGQPERVCQLLQTLPKNATLKWAWEPYATLVRKEQLEALQLVLDDDRFQCNAEFIVLSFYFTNRALRDLVIRHPKASRWRKDPSLLYAEYTDCLAAEGWPMNPGLQHRRAIGIELVRLWKDQAKNRLWAAVILYSRLTAFARWMVEKKMQEAKARFEATQHLLLNCFEESSL